MCAFRYRDGSNFFQSCSKWEESVVSGENEKFASRKFPFGFTCLLLPRNNRKEFLSSFVIEFTVRSTVIVDYEFRAVKLRRKTITRFRYENKERIAKEIRSKILLAFLTEISASMDAKKEKVSDSAILNATEISVELRMVRADARAG